MAKDAALFAVITQKKQGKPIWQALHNILN